MGSDELQPCASAGIGDFINCGLLQIRITHDAAFADVSAPDLELRLYERETFTAGLQDCRNSRQQHCKGDERSVNRDEIHGLAKVVRLEKPGIQLDHSNFGIVAHFPVELFDIDVERVDARGAIQKKK